MKISKIFYKNLIFRKLSIKTENFKKRIKKKIIKINSKYEIQLFSLYISF